MCKQNTAINELKRQAWEEVARGVNTLGEGELRTAAEVRSFLCSDHTFIFFYILSKSSPPLISTEHYTSSFLMSCTGEATLPGLACTDEAKTASGRALSLLLLLLVRGPED